MAYIPPITGYKPFYIQGADDEAATDTTVWGLVAHTNPYSLLPEAKEPYKNDWLDEDGEEEYTTTMHYKPLEFSVKFYVKTFATQTNSATKVLQTQLDTFFDKVKHGDFSICDTYTGLGRRKVRYVGYKTDSFIARDNWARLIFEVSLKCNDPITRMKISNGAIVEE